MRSIERVARVMLLAALIRIFCLLAADLPFGGCIKKALARYSCFTVLLGKLPILHSGAMQIPMVLFAADWALLGGVATFNWSFNTEVFRLVP